MTLKQNSRCLLRLTNWNSNLQLRNAKRAKTNISTLDFYISDSESEYIKYNKQSDFLSSHFLRYHGRWIDSVWKSRSYAGALKENPINLYIFWKLNSYRIQPYDWNFLKSYCRSIVKRNTQKHCFALTGSQFRAWIIGAARLTSEMFSHTSPSKRVSAIFQMWFGFFSTPS